MKKIMMMLLAMLTIAAVLAGCGKPEGTDGTGTENTAGVTSEAAVENQGSSGENWDADIPFLVNDGTYSYYLQEGDTEEGQQNYIMCVENVPGAIPEQVVHMPLLAGDGMSLFIYSLCGVQGEKLYYLEFASEESFSDTIIVKWTNRTGSEGGEVCRFPSQEYFCVKDKIIRNKMYLGFTEVDLENNTCSMIDIPEYSGAAGLSEEDVALGGYLYNILGTMDGQLVCFYTLPSEVNQSETVFKICQQDGEKETELFSRVLPIKDVQGLGLEEIALNMITDFANGKIYYYDLHQNFVGCIDLKNDEVKKIYSFPEDVSIGAAFYTISDGYLYAMTGGALLQVDMETLEEKQHPLPQSAEHYLNSEEFGLAPCAGGGCWIFGDSHLFESNLRFLPDQKDNGGFTLFEFMG